MSALMGLRTRLALARVGVIVPCGLSNVETLSSLVDAGADLLILEGSEDVEVDVDVLRSMRNRWGTSPLLVGTTEKKVAAPAAADVVHLKRPEWRFWGYPRGHEWTLLGRHASEVGVIQSPGVDFDYLFVPLAGPQDPLLAVGLEHQAPLTVDALPWFALGDFSPEDVEVLLVAGARRIALTVGLLERDDAVTVVRRTAGVVRQVWDDDHRSTAYRAAAFRR